MYAIDKFYRDAEKIAHKNPQPELCVRELERLFLPYTKGFGEAGQELFQYWVDVYGNDPVAHTAWLGDILYLLDGSTYENPCFTDEDWDEIRDEISASAGDIPIDQLTTIMQLIMQYHGLSD